MLPAKYHRTGCLSQRVKRAMLWSIDRDEGSNRHRPLSSIHNTLFSRFADTKEVKCGACNNRSSIRRIDAVKHSTERTQLAPPSRFGGVRQRIEEAGRYKSITRREQLLLDDERVCLARGVTVDHLPTHLLKGPIATSIIQ